MTEWPSDWVTKWPSGLVSSSKSEAKTSKEERRQAETSKEKQRRKAQTYENNSIQIKQLSQPQAFQAGLLSSWLRQVKHQDIPRPASVSCIIGIHYWDQVPDAGGTSGQCGNCHVQSEAEATTADTPWGGRAGGVGVVVARDSIILPRGSPNYIIIHTAIIMNIQILGIFYCYTSDRRLK